MNRFLQEYLKRNLLNREKGIEVVSPFRLAKAFYKFRVQTKTHIKDALLIALGITSAAFGLKSFLLPNAFIDGGAVGISLLIASLSDLDLPLTIVIVNIPFIVLGLKVIGRAFVLKTAIAIGALSIVLALMEFPQLTQEKLLVAVFGGFFLGAGIGMAVRGGCVIDGTEVLAISVSRKIGTTVGDVIMLINIIIFTAAAFLLSVETAMYSMITYLAASRTVDFIIEGIEEYTGVTIISPKSEEIRKMLTSKLGKGVTVYRGKRGFGKRGHSEEIDIIYTVITRLEISKLNAEVELIDPNAFVVMTSIKDTKGGMVKRRPFAH
jgi:uncharacterized membrane-anchored protein YitT (DUF2179 family)